MNRILGFSLGLVVGLLALTVGYASYADIRVTTKPTSPYAFRCAQAERDAAGEYVKIKDHESIDAAMVTCLAELQRDGKPKKVLTGSRELSISQMLVAATPAPSPTPPEAQPAKYSRLPPICSDTGSIGKQSCQLPPTRFGFPATSSIVKSDGTWLVFGDLVATANVLVCSVEQVPGAIADPYRELCLVDTYIAKSAVPLSATGVPGVATGSATLSWTPPSTNTDGSALTDLAGYTILYGAAPDALSIRVRVDDAAANSARIDNLPAGTWYFAILARNAAGAESVISNVASKTIA